VARLTGFVWSTFASVGGCVSDFESTGMYNFNSNTVPEYLFSINDASESIISMETAPLSMANVCVTSISVTLSQILLLFLPEPLSTTLSTILSSDTSTEEITSSRLLIKISSIGEYRENIQFKKTLFFLNEELNNIEERRKK
jgi:hypothetical protein